MARCSALKGEEPIDFRQLDGHQGMCRAPNYGHGRKKTARKVFEIDDGAPQHSASANPKRTRKPAALGPKATASASVDDPDLECDQSWANGPRGQASLEVLERAIDLVPNMRAAPSFLGTNSQAHPNPFSPIADLMDNGIEAGASEMRISLHKLRGEPMLTLTDNGRGMTERALLDGPLSLCYTSKHGTHYGMVRLGLGLESPNPEPNPSSNPNPNQARTTAWAPQRASR